MLGCRKPWKRGRRVHANRNRGWRNSGYVTCLKKIEISLFLFTFGGMIRLMSKEVATAFFLNWRGQELSKARQATEGWK